MKETGLNTYQKLPIKKMGRQNTKFFGLFERRDHMNGRLVKKHRPFTGLKFDFDHNKRGRNDARGVGFLCVDEVILTFPPNDSGIQSPLVPIGFGKELLEDCNDAFLPVASSFVAAVRIAPSSQAALRNGPKSSAVGSVSWTSFAGWTSL